MDSPNFNRNIFLFILVTITIVGTLVNSNLFVYQTLASYFLFTIVASFITIYFGIFLIYNHKSFRFSISIPVGLFLLWGSYIVCNNIVTGSVWNLRYTYLILSVLFYFSLSQIFVNGLYPVRWAYTIIILAALFEAIICILQSLEFTGSFNAYFKVTGTQVNPNITAMFLAMATGPLLYNLFYRKSFHLWTSVIALPFIIIALILLKCRTAYLGTVISTLLMLNSRYKMADRFKVKKIGFQFIVVLVLIGISTTLTIGLYQSKQASADGRKTIWKIASQMIVRKPLWGYGYGLFERNYNLQQAKYFEQGKATTQEITNADFVRMAYSEPLENAVEGGIMGLFFFMSAMIGLLVYYRKLVGFSKNHLTNESQMSESQGILPVAYAGVACFFVMSLGNFTIQAIPVMCLFLLYAGLLTSASISHKNNRNISHSGQRTIAITSGFIITAIALYFCYTQIISGLSHLELKQALKESNKENTQITLETLANLEPKLNTSEGYYRNYGRLLMDYGNYRQALEEFKKASDFTSLPDMYLMIGLCNVRLGNFSESERNFSLAMRMVPSRFAPKYYLMRLYQQKGDTLKTIQMAQTIAGMKIKIPSKDVDFYKKESLTIINHFEELRK